MAAADRSTPSAGERQLSHLYDVLFQAWPLMRQKLLPTSLRQEEIGMPLSHIEVLAMLDREGTMSVSRISECFGIARPNVTTLVDRMIGEGLVRRERTSADRRVVNVVICDEGRDRLHRIYDHLTQHLCAWAGTIDPDDLAAFNAALETIVRVLGAEK